jgi:hypothetical protein
MIAIDTLEFWLEIRKTSDNSVVEKRRMKGNMVPRIGEAIDCWEYGFMKTVAVIHDFKTPGSDTVIDVIVIAGFVDI